MASRGGPSGFVDNFHNNGTMRHDSNKENTSQQGSNAIRVQKERKTEWARPGRVFSRNIARGGYSRSSLPGVTQEFRIIKDNRIKLKEVSETLPEVSQNGDSSNDSAVSNVRDKSSTEMLAAQHGLVTCNTNGHGAAHADNGIKSANEVKPSIVLKLEQSEGGQASLVGSRAVSGKGNQKTADTAASGKNNFGGELCCSSSDPIHVPSPGSKSAGTFGAIKREVGVVGARQRPSNSAATNTSASIGLVKMAPKVSPHLEWKPKSVSPSSISHGVTAAPPAAPSLVDDGSKTEVSALPKKLSHANVSHEHVIIPEHIRIPDSERTHFIFGSFESETDPKASLTTSYDIVAKEDLNDHSPSSLAALDSTSTDGTPNARMDNVGSCSPLPQAESAVSVSEHQQSLTECVEVRSPGVVGEYVTNAMISSKVTHSQPRLQPHEATQNFKAMVLHSVNAYQLPASTATQQPVPQMFSQQFQVPQYPNFLPYRHVFSPQFGSPMVVPNYSGNPAFPQLPHGSSYLVMPNGASQLAANGMKYGSNHQYKQVFQGAPAGYGYANHNGYPVSNGVIGGTGAIEDTNMNKYKDNSLYAPNPQVETADVWVQSHRESPNMPSAAPFYNMVGQPVSPHAAYLPPHSGHAAFNPAPSHSAHLRYPGFAHALHPTSMTLVQNPQAMVHQPGAPPLAGNLGMDMAAMVPGSQVGAFQQNQLGHLGWTTQSF